MAKGSFVHNALKVHAKRSQTSVLQVLERDRIPHRAFFVVNAIWAKGNRSLILALAERPDVKNIIGQ